VQNRTVDFDHQIAFPILQDAPEVLELLLVHVLFEMYGFTLRGPASRLAGTGPSESASSSTGAGRETTMGRGSNLIWAAFSGIGFGAAGLGASAGFNGATVFTGAALTAAGFVAAGFEVTDFA
jgi:hypothetical protein